VPCFMQGGSFLVFGVPHVAPLLSLPAVAHHARSLAK
jgi:hypothetical protein